MTLFCGRCHVTSFQLSCFVFCCLQAYFDDFLDNWIKRMCVKSILAQTATETCKESRNFKVFQILGQEWFLLPQLRSRNRASTITMENAKLVKTREGGRMPEPCRFFSSEWDRAQGIFQQFYTGGGVRRLSLYGKENPGYGVGLTGSVIKTIPPHVLWASSSLGAQTNIARHNIYPSLRHGTSVPLYEIWPKRKRFADLNQNSKLDKILSVEFQKWKIFRD